MASYLVSKQSSLGLALIISCANFSQGYAQAARSHCSSISRTQADQSMIDFQRKNNSVQYGGKPWIILPPYGESKPTLIGPSVGDAPKLFMKLKEKEKQNNLRKSKKFLERILDCRKSMSENSEFKALQPSDQFNINILMDDLQAEPLQFLSAKEISKRLLGAYKHNIEAHETLRKLAKVKSQEIDFLRVSSVTRMKFNRKSESKKWHARMGLLWELESTFREAQLSLHYLSSRSAVERVNRNLGYVPVTEYNLHPMIKLPP